MLHTERGNSMIQSDLAPQTQTLRVTLASLVDSQGAHDFVRGTPTVKSGNILLADHLIAISTLFRVSLSAQALPRGTATPIQQVCTLMNSVCHVATQCFQ